MSKFTVTSGMSDIKKVDFIPGDKVHWSPKESKSSILHYHPKTKGSETPKWHATMSWDDQNQWYIGRPSFASSDYLSITIGDGPVLNALFHKGKPVGGDGDGEVGSWTADEDPGTEGET